MVGHNRFLNFKQSFQSGQDIDSNAEVLLFISLSNVCIIHVLVIYLTLSFVGDTFLCVLFLSFSFSLYLFLYFVIVVAVIATLTHIKHSLFHMAHTKPNAMKPCQFRTNKNYTLFKNPFECKQCIALSLACSELM